MNRLFFIFVTIFAFMGDYVAGKTKTVDVEYIYHIPSNVTLEEAKHTAFSRAQAQAIADEFGTIITQSTSTIIDNNMEGTTTDFLSIGGSELKGEWIETIGEPVYEVLTDGDALAVRVFAKGLIRELSGSQIPFDVKILRNGIDDSNESELFVSGDDMFMSFNASSSGYLAIYLIDAENNAFCLLPYSGQSEGFFQTKGNRRYLFFYPESSGDMDKSLVDQLVMETTNERERNRIITIYSKNKFYKAADERTSHDLPRNVCYNEFQKWLSNLKKRDVDMSISEKSILITRQ